MVGCAKKFFMVARFKVMLNSQFSTGSDLIFNKWSLDSVWFENLHFPFQSADETWSSSPFAAACGDSSMFSATPQKKSIYLARITIALIGLCSTEDYSLLGTLGTVVTSQSDVNLFPSRTITKRFPALS